MDDNVMIHIKTYQDIDGTGDEPIELETSGIFGSIGGKYYIKYKESAMTGFEDTKTTLKIWDKNVSVIRKGKYNMQIDYVEGERKLCLYPTPYGKLSAAVKTFKVDFDFNEKQGWLRADYTIDADNVNFIKNSLRVRIEPLDAHEKTDKPKPLKLNNIT